jgi:hypothetical protein
MGPPSYMRPVVDRNVVMRRMTVLGQTPVPVPLCPKQVPFTLITDNRKREQSVEF